MLRFSAMTALVRPSACGRATCPARCWPAQLGEQSGQDRKSTRLNSSHSQISYAVFCLKKKNIKTIPFDVYCPAAGTVRVLESISRHVPVLYLIHTLFLRDRAVLLQFFDVCPGKLNILI